MIHNMIGGGSASLNFKITGNPQPASPRDNTIWINTDTPITSWMFNADQPTTPTEGMTWIIVGKSSPAAFNILKKNGIMVYPVSAKQYIGGEWVVKTAKSYQGGEWVEWIPVGALYYSGNECVDESGGWQARGWRVDSTYSGTVVPTITNNDDHMSIVVPSANVAGGAVEVKKDQDLTNVNSISIDFEMTANEFNVRLMVIARNATTMDDSVKSILLNDAPTTTVERKKITLDVSSVSGSYDVVIAFADMWNGSKPDGVTMKVYSVVKE